MPIEDQHLIISAVQQEISLHHEHRTLTSVCSPYAPHSWPNKLISSYTSWGLPMFSRACGLSVTLELCGIESFSFFLLNHNNVRKHYTTLWNYDISASQVLLDGEQLQFENSCFISSKWGNFFMDYKIYEPIPVPLKFLQYTDITDVGLTVSIELFIQWVISPLWIASLKAATVQWIGRMNWNAWETQFQSGSFACKANICITRSWHNILWSADYHSDETLQRGNFLLRGVELKVVGYKL